MSPGTSSENSDTDGDRPVSMGPIQLHDKMSTMERMRVQPSLSHHSSSSYFRSGNPHQQSQQLQSEQHQQLPQSSSPFTTGAATSTPGTVLSVTSSSSLAAATPTSTSSAAATRYVVEEETTTVRVPMLRPKPALLKVLRLSGGSGETFTMGDIIRYVKEYISARRLYDEQDPKVVHCGGDLLGEALGVESFTVHDAIQLFSRNCYLEPDSCIRIRRNLVTRAINTEHQPTSEHSGASVYTTAPHSVQTQTRAASSTSTTSSTLPPDVPQQRCTPDSTNLSQEAGPVSSSVSSQDLPNSAQSRLSSSLTSSFSSQPSSSSSSSAVISFKAASSSITVTDSDLERSQKEKHPGTSTTDSSSDCGNKPRSREHTRRRGGQKKSNVQMRQRSTSINVTCDEPDGAYEVRMETSTGEMERPEDDTLVVEFDSDTFSVEYEVESDDEEETKGNIQDDQGLSESDVSSSTSTTALLVVCKESDVEYLADYSDSDNMSDSELTDADKWQCEYCSMKNPPFQRNCGGCWGVRPDWLPSSGKESEGGAKDSSQNDSIVMTAVGSSTDDVANSSFIASQESAICSKTSSQEKEFTTGFAQILKEYHARKSSPQKRKYSSCISTSDSQEEKMKDIEVKEVEDAVTTEAQPSEEVMVKRGKKKPVTVSLSKDDPCVVCLTRKKVASIIHGKTGHQVCCYRCARRLKKQRKSCPVCRRPIQKVIRNYHL